MWLLWGPRDTLTGGERIHNFILLLFSMMLMLKLYLGKLSYKKNGKIGDIVHTGRRGVNPSSFIKPKFTGLSNHPEMEMEIDTTI